MAHKPRGTTALPSGCLSNAAALATLLLLVLCLWPPALFCSPVYKYQKDGVWHFTDTPSEHMPADSRKIAPADPAAAPHDNQYPLLQVQYPAANAIERSTAATVAVKSALGFGSGFFVSPDGHILTNKHVVRTTEGSTAPIEARFKAGEERIATIEKRFAEELGHIRDFQVRLDRLQNLAQSETHPERRRMYQHDFEINHQSHRARRADYEQRLADFETEKKRFYESRRDYQYSTSVADLSQSFTIILADGTHKYVRLVALSADHDLALLKLDGYRTPCLRPAARPAQGDPVYAIGSPAKLHNSVTSGIFSGFQQGFVQTNAQIYPGNSGGPLVTTEGHVLGINTFKTLTHKFEGLGFAIPIETALAAFSIHLPPQ
jgi:serine protease Do